MVVVMRFSLDEMVIKVRVRVLMMRWVPGSEGDGGEGWWWVLEREEIDLRCHNIWVCGGVGGG